MDVMLARLVRLPESSMNCTLICITPHAVITILYGIFNNTYYVTFNCYWFLISQIYPTVNLKPRDHCIKSIVENIIMVLNFTFLHLV